MKKLNFSPNSASTILILFSFGLASGLPFLLIGGTLKLWLTRENIEITTIGLLGWTTLSYSLRFLWAQVFDRFEVLGLGRRRGWMVVLQTGVILGLVGMSRLQPASDLQWMAVNAIVLGFLSASLDCVIDAYRREILPDSAQGWAATIHAYGYRLAMLISGGLGVSLVGEYLAWGELYLVAAGFLVITIGVTLIAREPENVTTGPLEKFSLSAFLAPFRDFLKRPQAWTILAFILFYKIGDAIGGAMLNPFYVQMNYTNQQIGLIAKTMGMISALAGVGIGGWMVTKWGIFRTAWICGFLQALSTASFALIPWFGATSGMLAFTVMFEDISANMGAAAFLALIATQTNRQFTATQYATMAGIALLGRTFFSGFSGYLALQLGWAPFFITCALFSIPGMYLLWRIRRDITVS